MSQDWYPQPGEKDDDNDALMNNINQRTEELYRVPNSEPDENGIIILPAINLQDGVIFPHMVSPIFLFDPEDVAALNEAQFHNQTVIALFEKELEPSETDDTAQFFSMGVEMAVGRLINLQDDNHSALVQGRNRVEIIEFVQTEPFYIVRARVVTENYHMTRQFNALIRSVRRQFERCVEMNRSLPEEAHLFSMNINDPGWLADLIATTLSLSSRERFILLLMVDPADRLKKINQLLAEEINVLELEDEIQTRVQTEVDRSQREYYLREQMKVIQNELGEGDIWTQEISEIAERIEKLALEADVHKQAMRELERLKQMPSMAPEVGMIRTYLDWIVDLPWGKMTEDHLDVKNASKVLDAYHYGLQKAKDRILEYIAVRCLKPKHTRQPILCFVGPPGTGKTSLGRSIADALGRAFVRVSLGGVRDEAEIRGHRRTYIGAMPGRILQTMRRAGSMNPLFMLDEIDKLGADFRGDPSSALLEVLDPEQNNAFSDHYLEVAFDLSNVIFITTANSLMNIPPALLDRLEVIEFPGYIEEEKIEIAHRFLLPRQKDEAGLADELIVFQNAALEKIIREYTYEAGVRNFERELGRVFRRIARLKAEQKRFPKTVTPALVVKYLGPEQFFATEAEQTDEIGVATAVAWTETGGDIMPIEVLIMDGKGNLQLTGQLGEVMQESAQAAMSYLKSRAPELDIDSGIFENLDVHIHVPEGAIPKDGPSAGITMATALVSAFTLRPVYHDVGMTGEITLRGRVLPIGGLREKVLAAYRAGLKTVIVPEKNLKDLVDVPKNVLPQLNIVSVNHMDDVLRIALHPPEEKPKTVKTKRTKKASEQAEAQKDEEK